MTRFSIQRGLFAALTFVVSSSLVLSTTAPARAVSNEFYDAASAKVDYSATPVHSSFSCASLAGRHDAAARIVTASVVPAGKFAPSYCDVRGIIAPSIQIEVALPLAWNQRLYVFGNGGFAGEPLNRIDRVQQLTVAVAHGFAVAQTDTGHQGNALGVLDGSWALNRPDLVVDYAYRAIHATNVEAKKLVALFYSQKARYSYFNGCSDGGREAYEEAQKFPDDFDGIVGAAVFAAGIDTNIDGLWVLRHLAPPLNFTAGKFFTIGVADVAKCDALDGDVDGIIGDPRRCNFSAKRDVQRCAGQSDADSCLTAAEAEAYDTGLGGPVYSNGRPYFPRYPSGPEADFGFLGIFLPVTVNGVLYPAVGKVFADEFTQYIFPFPASGNYFSVANFNFDTGPSQVVGARRVLNALTPKIGPFLRHGGKMITYTGWADPLINPYASVGYYENVLHELGNGIESSFRLFMVPGMHHCSGGPGYDAIDAMTPLIDWKEGSITPPQMITHKFAPDGSVGSATHKLCAYPNEARYVGPDITKASSFRCVVSDQRGVPDTPIHE